MKPILSNKTKNKLHSIIFEADTPVGKLFDIVLLIVIFFSIIVVMLESVASIDAKNHRLFYTIEWIITIFFTIEYILRTITIDKPKNYIFSFYEIIDIPTGIVGAEYTTSQKFIPIHKFVNNVIPRIITINQIIVINVKRLD